MKGEERYRLLLCELSLNFIWKVSVDIKVPAKCSPDPTRNLRGVHPACLPSAHSTLRRN